MLRQLMEDIAMNYYAARELLNKPGKWHYTVCNDNQISAVGYCAKKCSGHDTPEEACAHFRQYLLDERVRYGEVTDQQRKCAECGAWTKQYAQVDGWTMYFLCEKHLNPTTLEKLYPEVHEITSS